MKVDERSSSIISQLLRTTSLLVGVIEMITHNA